MDLLREQLWNLQSLLYAALLAKLLWNGLWRQYRWFTSLICCETVRGVAFHLIPQDTHFYLVSYIVSESLVWILTVFVVQEIYGLVFTSYRGLETWGRRILVGSACLSVCLVFLLLWTTEYQTGTNWKWQLQALFTIERTLALSLAFFLLLIAVCLACLPVPLHRTVVLHCAVYFSYFVGVSLGFLYLQSNPLAQHALGDAALMSLCCLCLGAWLITMQPMDALSHASIARRYSLRQEKFLMDQLDSVNHFLMKSLRR